MYDILLSDDDELHAKARALGITPLTLGKEIALVESASDIKQTTTLIALGTKPRRSLFEAPIDGVISIETAAPKDHLHYRKAGLDMIAARILAEENKALVLSMHAIRDSDDPGRILGRMRQNAEIARKKGAPVLLVSGARTADELPAPHDLEAFYKSTGIPEDLCSRNQQALAAWVERAKNRASDRYVAEGVSKTESL